MLPQYASLCGLTESEIHRYMEEGIQNLAATQHLTYDGTCRKLKVLYDGYHFSPGSEGIYNPFSILRTHLWGRRAHPGHLSERVPYHKGIQPAF